VRLPAGLTERIERLCRYAARPPIVMDRLSRTDDGKILYKLKQRFRDGSTHVVFTPHSLIERLCALIPRPRKKTVNYYGIFAPAAGRRDRVVPQSVPDDHPRGERAHPAADAPVQDHAPRPERPANPVPHSPARPRSPDNPRYYRWAELLRRVLLVDVLTCPHGSAPRRLLAAIFDPDSIARILTGLALPTEPPTIEPARPPPQAAFDW